MNKNRQIHLALTGTTLVMSLLLTAASAHATLVVYNGSEPNTLHYWSLNEPSGSYADTGGSPTAINLGAIGGIQGAEAYSGYGNSLQVKYGSSDAPYAAGASSAYSTSLLQGADGAFTYEGMIYLDAYSSSGTQVIFSTDAWAADRAFQVRIDSGDLHLIGNIAAGSPRPEVRAVLPTTGDHAVTTGAWFHWAVAYDGSAAADDTKLYWTKVDPSYTEANLIGTSTLGEDLLGAYDSQVWIGTRQNFNISDSNPVQGRVDEVRVSSVALGAGNMIFIPEPSSFALLAGAATVFLAIRRRGRA